MDSTWTKILLYFFTLMCHKLRNMGIHLIYISTGSVDSLTCGLSFFFLDYLDCENSTQNCRFSHEARRLI